MIAPPPVREARPARGRTTILEHPVDPDLRQRAQGADQGSIPQKIKARKKGASPPIPSASLLVFLVHRASVQDTTAPATWCAARPPPPSSSASTTAAAAPRHRAGAGAGIRRLRLSARVPAGRVSCRSGRAVRRRFGWWMLHRRFVHNYRHAQNVPDHDPLAMIDNMSRRATGESTQTWHDDPPKPDQTISDLRSDAAGPGGPLSEKTAHFSDNPSSMCGAGPASGPSPGPAGPRSGRPGAGNRCRSPVQRHTESLPDVALSADPASGRATCVAVVASRAGSPGRDGGICPAAGLCPFASSGRCL